MANKKRLIAFFWVFYRFMKINAFLPLVVPIHKFFIYCQPRLRSARYQNTVSRHLKPLSNLNQVSDHELATFDILYFSTVSVNWHEGNICFLCEFCQTTFLLKLDKVLCDKNHQNDHKDSKALIYSDMPAILGHREDGSNKSCYK